MEGAGWPHSEAAGVRCIKKREIVKHRIISAIFELPDRTRVKVVVSYMDGLKVKGKQARKVEEKRWEDLQKEGGGEAVVLLGDLNTTRGEKGWAGVGGDWLVATKGSIDGRIEH